MALPLAESDCGQRISGATPPILLVTNSRRRQEIDRVDDGQRLDAFLRPEVDLAHAIHDLGREIRRFHVRRLQRAHRHAAVRLDRQAQHHLPFQSRVIAQLTVVQPIERSLVAVEHDLYFFVGTGSSRPTARLWSVGATYRGDRTGRAAYARALATACSSATAATTTTPTDSTTTVATATSSSATASYAAVERGDVDAAARSRRIGCQRGG